MSPIGPRWRLAEASAQASDGVARGILTRGGWPATGGAGIGPRV
jgi:hypothetical protein